MATSSQRGLRAFLANRGQGVNYGKGLWHHALIALNEVSDFVVVDRGGAGSNCDETQLTHALTISKEDIARAAARTEPCPT